MLTGDLKLAEDFSSQAIRPRFANGEGHTC